MNIIYIFFTLYHYYERSVKSDKIRKILRHIDLFIRELIESNHIDIFLIYNNFLGKNTKRTINKIYNLDKENFLNEVKNEIRQRIYCYNTLGLMLLVLGKLCDFYLQYITFASPIIILIIMLISYGHKNAHMYLNYAKITDSDALFLRDIENKYYGFIAGRIRYPIFSIGTIYFLCQIMPYSKF